MTDATPDRPPAPNERAEPIACAFCGSTDTELYSLFGQFLLASQYLCRHCRSVFDVVRWTEEAPGGPRPPQR